MIRVMLALVGVMMATVVQAAEVKLAAAGPQGSDGYRMAEAVCAAVGLEQKNTVCKAVAAADEVEALRLLATGQVEFAVSLSPRIGEALGASGAFAGQANYPDLRTVTGLYDQYLFIGASMKKKGASFDDLLGARLRVDMPGTASRIAADQLLDSFSYTYARFSSVLELPESKVEEPLCADQLDGLIAFTVPRSPLVDYFINKCGGRILPLDDVARGDFRIDHPGYRSAGLESGTFYRLHYPVTTVSGQMMIATRKDVDEEAVAALAATVAHQGQAIRRMAPAFEPSAWKNTPLFSQLPLHKGVEAVYQTDKAAKK